MLAKLYGAVSRKPMADVPGQVYEQFLGKVIRLTPGHQPEVRRDGELRLARLTSAHRHPKMQSMSAQDRLALTGAELCIRN